MLRREESLIRDYDFLLLVIFAAKTGNRTGCLSPNTQIKGLTKIKGFGTKSLLA
jgi:hypothetical protein